LIKAGIGYCDKQDAFSSGREAARSAAQSGNLRTPGLALAFCSGKLNPEEFFRGVKETVGDIPVIGGSTIGIITNDFLSYKGCPAGVMLLQLEGLNCQTASVDGLDADEKTAGRGLVQAFTPSDRDRLLLMFYDSVKVPASPASPPVMNASPPLIAGIHSLLPENVPVIGAGLVGDYQFSRTRQFCGDAVSEQCVVGALLSGPVSVYYSIMHGCSPFDGKYRTITRMQGSAIQELDGRPIVDIIDEAYGGRSWRTQHPLSLLTIGVNHGEKFTFREDNFVNRLITGVLPDNSGIGIFEPDLKEGTEIQFMLRDGGMMIESAKSNSEALMESITAGGKTPLCGLYIDCAGRAAGQSNTETEEAAEVQRVMNSYHTPLLGFYSGVEVAPILGKSTGLDWTGVLMVLAQDKANG
jgi:hypothetical protein